MKKNNNKSTIAIIAILIIVIVLLLGIMVFLLCGRSISLPLKAYDDSSMQDYSQSFDIDNDTKLDISTEFGNIIFKESENEQLVIEGKNYNASTLKSSLNANKLIVKRNYSGFSGLSLNGINNINCDINVYIPKDYEGKISAECNAGNIIADTELKGKIDFEADAGTIEIESITGEFELSVDAGNIEIANAQLTSNSIAEIDMGNITIKNLNPVNITANANLGNAAVNGNDSNSPITLKAEVDLGNIEIN